MEVICDFCGKSFDRKKSQVEKYKNNFCSVECRKNGMLKVNTAGQFKVVYDHFDNNGNIICTNCGEYKDPKHFSKRKDLKHRNFLDYMCNECVKTRSKRAYCETRESKLKWRETTDGYIKSMIQRVNNRKKELSDGFKLSFEYVKNIYNEQNGLCNLSGVKMTTITGNGKILTNMSIDRIDSNKGYIVGNIQLVCTIVNIMKTTLSVDEFKTWCTLISNKSKNE